MKTGESATRLRRVPRAPMLLAIISAVLAVATAVSVVPRIRVVEAIILCATAFAAGAGFATAVADRRRGAVR